MRGAHRLEQQLAHVEAVLGIRKRSPGAVPNRMRRLAWMSSSSEVISTPRPLQRELGRKAPPRAEERGRRLLGSSVPWQVSLRSSDDHRGLAHRRHGAAAGRCRSCAAPADRRSDRGAARRERAHRGLVGDGRQRATCMSPATAAGMPPISTVATPGPGWSRRGSWCRRLGLRGAWSVGGTQLILHASRPSPSWWRVLDNSAAGGARPA